MKIIATGIEGLKIIEADMPGLPRSGVAVIKKSFIGQNPWKLDFD